MAFFSILCIIFSFFILLIISSILYKGFWNKKSEYIWIIYLSLIISSLFIYWYMETGEYFFWKDNIEEFNRIQEMYKNTKEVSDITSNNTNLTSDTPEPRALHMTEIFRYIKVAVYEELIKVTIAILLFIIYIISNKNTISKISYQHILLFTVFVSSFSFYFLENIIYASNEIPTMAMFFRTISPAHFFMFIIMIYVINFSKITKINLLIILLVSIVIHFSFDSLLTMNYWWFWALIVFLWLFMWTMGIYEYTENNNRYI